MVEQWCERARRARYEAAGHGFQLVAGGRRLPLPDRVRPAPYVERFVLDGQRARLSAAALETLAIVAYKQPISRAQVAVDPRRRPRRRDAHAAGRGYIDEVGRDTGPGQAMLFGTTATFLEKLGLDSLADLPPIAEFVPGADVVEALEHGLRVTPLIEVSTGTADEPTPPGAASSDDSTP